MPSTFARGPSFQPAGAMRLLMLNAAVAAVYVGLAAVALTLAGPPGYAAPLYPSAGWALAAVLVWRHRVLPGVALASALVNIGIGLLTDRSGSAVWLMPAVIGLGAAAQAGVGAWLVWRFVAHPIVLNVGRDVLVFALAGAGLACAISPSVATAALLAQGVLPWVGLGSNWLTWYMGDAFGVLIATPVALAFIARPRADWRPRRLTLGGPLLGATLLLAAAMWTTRHAEQARLSLVFERDVERLVRSVDARLSEPMHLLQAARSALELQGSMTGDELLAASRWWMGMPARPQAVGFSVWVPNDEIPAFEAAARQEGLEGYRVFDRDDGSARARDGGVVAIRQIAPKRGNTGALGVNTLSIPAAREAVLGARRTGAATATAGFRLTQAVGDETGVVLYQALYRGVPQDEVERQNLFRGVVFVTLSTDRLLAELLADTGSLRGCLVDPAPGVPRPRLAGAPGCERAQPQSTQLSAERPLFLAGRPLQLRVSSERDALETPGSGAPWLLAAAGLVATSLLGALLLVVTGQARRTELVVRRATTQLRQEIRDRSQAEQALRESEQRVRVILDQAPIGVLFVDPRGVVLQCNPRMAEMVGRPPATLYGRGVIDLVDPADWATIVAQRRELMAGQALTSSIAVRLLRADGSRLDVRVVASAQRDEGGHVQRMIAAVEDITEHLQLEASERSRRAAEAASRAKSEFLSRMSHELRTPLNAMIGFAQLMEMPGTDRNGRQHTEWLKQIQQSGWHLLALINETLDLARVESGVAGLDLSTVSVLDEVQAAQSMLAGSASRHGVTVTLDVDPTLTVHADATRLRQIVSNLLSNAIKYNHSGGTVRVEARRVPGRRVELQVIDTGLGMTDEQLTSLFQPYNRLGRERTAIEGTGIGLVISLRLAEAMNGTLVARSDAGAGSTFVLTLPEAEGPPAEAPVVVGGDDLLSHRPTRRRVHYIEDNDTNIEIMRGLFGTRPHYALTVSRLGLDGLAAIRHQRPDLVLLDMNLPDIDGLQLLLHLKDDDELAAIPVIIVSADANPAHVRQALTHGARSYVTKPLQVKPFLELLDTALAEQDTRW